jgi:hypothetical protein
MLGASAWQAPAQVYSLNVVGYYNVSLASGWNLLANQFIALAPATYNANWVIQPYSEEADGALLYRFDPVNQTYYDAATYITGVGWYPVSGDTNDPVLNLPVGEGFFIWTPQAWTATFVGEVAQGDLVNPLLANYSLKASIIPLDGRLHADLIFPPFAGDQVWRCVGSAFSPYAYDATGLAWLPSEPSLRVGEAFFLYRSPDQATTDHWWTWTFFVQAIPSPLPAPKIAMPSAAASTAMRIRGLSFRKGLVALDIKNAAGSPYNVQFSTDRRSWTTIATSVTASLWQEPARSGVRGYYQLVNP